MRPFMKKMLLVAAAIIIMVAEPLSILRGDNIVSADMDESDYEGGGAAVTGQADDIGYATKLYDATNGLPTSDANTILATSDGFIWIGSYSGLIRYDGTTFERQDSSTGVTNANTLFEDSKNRLWVGTNDNGVVMLDNGESMHWDYKEGLSASSVRSITEDNNGNIIIGTTQGVDYIDNNLKLNKLDEPQINDNYITVLVADAEGTVYGCSKAGSFFRINQLKVDAYYNGRDLGIGDISTIYPVPGKEGYVYLGTYESMVCRGTFEDNFKKLDRISVLVNKDDSSQAAGDNNNASDTAGEKLTIYSISYVCKRIWLIADDNVGYLDENDVFHEVKNLPMNNRFGHIIEDYEGNLWFCSDRQGVMKLVANKFTNITEQAALDQVVVNSTCVHDGLLYVGTDSGLQIVYKDHHHADIDYRHVDNDIKAFIGESRVRCVAEDNDKNMWISTYASGLGLVCLKSDGEIVNYTEDKGLLSNDVRGTTFTSDGSVLVATNGGVNVIKDGKITRSIDGASGLGNTIILTAIEGFDGKYYIGTDGGGMYVVDGNNIIKKGRDDGLTSDVILRMKKDEKRGVIWIVTSNAIEYLKDDVITQVKSFPYTNNYDIYFDNGDNLWILSSYGIYIVKAQEMFEDDELEYLLYNTLSGLPIVPTANAFSEISSDGMLYIAGRSGVSSVNINRYFDKTHDIRLRVPYIEADGKRYYINSDNTVNLPSDIDTVTIYGYAITYSMQNPKIQYMLDGFDKEAGTVMKNDMEPVRYTNLNGGTYVYKLSVVNNSTDAVQQQLNITIIKAKAFYEQIWFYVLCVIFGIMLIILIVWLYISHKTKLYKKKEQENKEFIREITKAFAKTIDMKDKYTNGHSGRVAEYTAMLTRELGYDEETAEKYYNIALLHDIGKIGVPPEVLNKPGKLDDDEFKIIKSHSALGYEALKEISIMPELAIGAGAHHERPDGKGYPKGLKGEDIPRVAQIIAVADTFDAMYSNRPYRKRMNFDKAVSIIKEVSGTQLTEDVVDAFLRLVDKGEFRDEDDMGGGTMEDIDNIHKSYEDK